VGMTGRSPEIGVGSGLAGVSVGRAKVGCGARVGIELGIVAVVCTLSRLLKRPQHEQAQVDNHTRNDKPTRKARSFTHAPFDRVRSRRQSRGRRSILTIEQSDSIFNEGGSVLAPSC